MREVELGLTRLVSFTGKRVDDVFGSLSKCESLRLRVGKERRLTQSWAHRVPCVTVTLDRLCPTPANDSNVSPVKKGTAEFTATQLRKEVQKGSTTKPRGEAKKREE